MDSEIIKIVGQVAGLGGIAIGTFLILFREVIRKNIFPNLTKTQGYRLLILIVILIWTIAIAGIFVWAYTKKPERNRTADDKRNLSNQSATNPLNAVMEYKLSGFVMDTRSNRISGVNISVLGSDAKTQSHSDGTFILNIKGEKDKQVRIQAVKDGYVDWNEYKYLPDENVIIQLEVK